MVILCSIPGGSYLANIEQHARMMLHFLYAGGFRIWMDLVVCSKGMLV